MATEWTQEVLTEQLSQKSLKQIFEEIQADGKIDEKDKAQITELENRFRQESEAVSADTRTKFKELLSQTLTNGFEIKAKNGLSQADYEVFQKMVKLWWIDITLPSFENLKTKIESIPWRQKFEAITFILDGNQIRVAPRTEWAWTDGVNEFILDKNGIKRDERFFKIWGEGMIGNNNQLYSWNSKDAVSDLEDTFKDTAKAGMEALKTHPDMPKEEFDKTVAKVEEALKNLSSDAGWGKLKEAVLKELAEIKLQREKKEIPAEIPLVVADATLSENVELSWGDASFKLQDETKLQKTLRYIDEKSIWFDYKNPTKENIISTLERFEKGDFFKKGKTIDSKDLVQSIYWVQVALSKMGIDVWVVDGGWGENTKKWVMAFQEKMKIEPKDGIPWSVTISKILEILKKNPTAVAAVQPIRPKVS